MEFSFSGEMWHWRGPSPFHFVSMPRQMSDELKEDAARLSYGWGAIAVECRSGDVEWRTSIFPKDGRFIVPIKNAVRFALEVEVGDEIEIDLKIAPKSHQLWKKKSS